MKIYEYVVVIDWLDNLEKGTRLYYDYAKHGYVYHYESERSSKNSKYSMKSLTTEDFFIDPNTVEVSISNGVFAPGPELGEFEQKPLTDGK
jgi:hypothetical protein